MFKYHSAPKVFTVKNFLFLIKTKKKDFNRIASTKSLYYKKVKTLKKNGIDYREIYQPTNELKNILKKINRKYLSNFNFPSFVHCGPPGKSIITAAKGHQNFEQHLSMDIVAFFDRVSQKAVESSLLERKVKKGVINSVIRLAVEDNRLPQGFPTSPLLSALVLSSALKDFYSFFSHDQILLSVYADDVLVSANHKDLLEKAEEYIKENLSKVGLVLKDSKREHARKGSKFTWLGLQIHPWICVPRRKLAQLQKQAYLYKTRKIISPDFQRDNTKKTKIKTQWKESMRGKVAFVKHVNKRSSLITKTEQALI